MFTQISKQVGWKPKLNIQYPKPHDVETLIKYAKQGDNNAFAQLLRYNRYLHSPRSDQQRIVLDLITKGFRETKGLFEQGGKYAG